MLLYHAAFKCEVFVFTLRPVSILSYVTGFGKTLRMGPRAQLFYKRFYCLW